MKGNSNCQCLIHEMNVGLRCRSSPARQNHFTRRRVSDVTDLVVLDGEEDEAVRVLLEERLVGLKLLDARSNLGGLDSLLGGLGGGRVDVLERRGRVLLADRLEIELLDR